MLTLGSRVAAAGVIERGVPLLLRIAEVAPSAAPSHQRAALSHGGASYGGGKGGLPAGMSFAEAVAPLREGGQQAHCMVAQRAATTNKSPAREAGLGGSCLLLVDQI